MHASRSSLSPRICAGVHGAYSSLQLLQTVLAPNNKDQLVHVMDPHLAQQHL